MTTSSPITGVRTVSIPVEDQDAAIAFYTEVLGFTIVRDMPTPNGRWIELSPGGDVILTLEPASPGISRGAIGIRFTSDDVDGSHATMAERGVDTDDILRWPGVPAMFAFRDPDGNAFSVSATA